MTKPRRPKQLTYRDAGVDIDAGDRLVENIKPFARKTMRKGVLAGIGGFGALFQIARGRYREPVLVSGTDGVGTKLKLAFELDRHATIGIDLVAMSVNDILTLGAEPLFFLDYYACGRLDVATATAVVKGIAAGCKQAGCALIGGETAEMPGMYPAGEYDLAGFAVGIVEKSRIIDGTDIAEGDAVLGLASSGAHSNGYSLIRKIIAAGGVDLAMKFHGRTLADAILEPTRIYVKPVLKLDAHRHRQRPCPHHRRRPRGQRAARPVRRAWRRASSAAPGPCRRCFSGSRSRATSRTRNSSASSTAASAWWWWSARPTPPGR